MSFFLNTTVCGFSLYHILAFFLIYSCLGWCVEVVYAAATTGQLVNRGFLNGPVCPIYGFGMILVLFFLTPLEDNLLLLYLGGVILPSALELVGGWALYKLYRTRWWDYTDKPFNIGGYVCLEFSLMWGLGAMVMVKVIHPTIAALVNIIPPLVGFVLMCLLYAVYAADVVATAIAASDLARELDALEKVADSMHAVSDAMTEILGTTALDMDQKMDESRLQFKLAAAEMEGRNASVITIGKKAQEHYAKRQWPVAADYPGVAETMRISDTHEIVGSLVEAFCSGRADEVFLCYTEFVSPLQQEAKCIQLLPVSFERKENADKGGAHVLTEYDPSPEAVFNAVIPEYLYGVLYGAVVESYCSEQSARRMAMEAASDNAGEMIENLNLSYNRARQAAITQEITEIVAGSGEVGA